MNVDSRKVFALLFFSLIIISPNLYAQTVIGLEAGHILLASVLILCGIGVYFSVRGIVETVTEGTAIRHDAATLIRRDLMPSENKRQLARIKKRGMGLRLKLASYTIALVLAVNVIASVPLFLMMIRSMKETLFTSLWDRATVLVEGLAANARPYLSQGNIKELGLLPAQMNSIPEAMYVTITGYNPETLVFEDQVWATNDPNILRKIDSQVLHLGYSRITDAISPRIKVLSAELNAMARERATGFAETIVNLYQEADELAKDSYTPEVSQRLDEIQLNINMLDTKLSDVLYRVNSGIWSEPDYSLENFDVSQSSRFIFFKPIMYCHTAEDEFFWGLVRLEISINSILAEIDEGVKNLLIVNVLIALVAQIIGAIGAWILSTLLVRPIRQLVRHVEIIRDTEDKAKLRDVEIRLKSSDEIAILGDTINDMTQSIATAALAAGDLSIGKEVQKKFLPLNLDSKGNKLSSGFEDTNYLNLFCYYEGAKGVSGDYFDYQELDDRYYAIIKCDVAGKGIPAAFIMIQVATMFLNFFRQWEPNEQGMRIEELVYLMNEFIETLAFKGRFAAFTLCLYDSETGTMRFCNAGDNIIHIFDASEGKVVTHTLPETPAAGALSNLDVESKGGYRIQTLTLDHGDMLLLYTDGIEESKRKFRNAKFEEIKCGEGTPHENHVAGQSAEELGSERVEDIINAVMNKQVYTLNKWHNPEGDDKNLQFDFGTCQGNTEDVILAMVAVEKMFRCYRKPNASKENQVLIDKIVDNFLKKHFLQYRQYCYNTQDNPANDAYMYYTHVMEDEQYDDLTILGIMRK
uniref:HAMP domain-containing protein n=1 Tax=uncultured bacterium contig00014 TaxID=1181505 RepID=A0A806K0U7_9BACT|nr:FIG01187070: hypothetical protein [uncultured bacterium contig00014]